MTAQIDRRDLIRKQDPSIVALALKRVAERGGPHAHWKVDLKGHVAMHGLHEVRWYEATDGSIVPNGYSWEGGDISTEEDCQLYEEAIASIAAFLSANGSWWVLLEGDKADIDALETEARLAACNVVRDPDGKVYLTSVEIDAIADAKEVLPAADQIVEILNGLARLRHPDHRSVMVSDKYGNARLLDNQPARHEIRALEEDRRHRPFRLVNRRAGIGAPLFGKAQQSGRWLLLPVVAHLPGEEVDFGQSLCSCSIGLEPLRFRQDIVVGENDEIAMRRVECAVQREALSLSRLRKRDQRQGALIFFQDGGRAIAAGDVDGDHLDRLPSGAEPLQSFESQGQRRGSVCAWS